LKHLLIAEGKGLLRYASGAVHQTIYFPEVKAFHICFPPRAEQRKIVAKLDCLAEQANRLEDVCRRKLAALNDLRQSVFHHAFTGRLASSPQGDRDVVEN
jgi:type I restriction enzyme S subunit